MLYLLYKLAITEKFERFEELLAEHFYDQAIQLFDLENSYYDWLRSNFRRVRKLPSEKVFVNSLSTSYLSSEGFSRVSKKI